MLIIETIDNRIKKACQSIGYLYSKNWKTYLLKDFHNKNTFKLINKQRYLKRKRKFEYCLSYDTETYKGKCKLLCRNEGNKKYLLNPTFSDCLDFLFFKANKSNGYRFFFNIDFDISAILKLWNNIKLIQALKEGKEVYYLTDKSNYKLYWLLGKMFKITKNKKTAVFTDLFSFFQIGLNTAVKTYLNSEGKDNIDGNLLNTSLSYWKKNLDDIIKYCIKDCQLTNDLAKYLIENIQKAEVSLPKYLVSAGSLAKADFRTNCFIPNLRNIPKSIINISYRTYYGGKFEISKKGFFDSGYLYDIVSQYPTFIRDIYDISSGSWKIVNYVSKKPSIAYYLVDLELPLGLYFSTIQYKLKSGKIISVVGNIKNKWCNWYDLDLMRKYITKIHFGVKFKKSRKDIPPDKEYYYYPFRNRIDYHFNKKSYYKENNNEILTKIHKLTMNSVYGSFIERHIDKNEIINSVGILFNPIYASNICSFGRWSIIKDIPINKWKHINAIHTDSIITDIDVSNYLDIGKKLGQFELEAKGKTIILNSGMYQIGYKNATRTYPKKYIKNWLRFCYKHLDDSEYTIKWKTMRKISEGLIRDKSLINVNQMLENKRTINPNSDSKRNWLDKFINFRDVLNRNIDSYLYVVDMNRKENSIDLKKNIFQNPLTYY